MPFPTVIPDLERYGVQARKFLDYVTPHLSPPAPPPMPPAPAMPEGGGVPPAMPMPAMPQAPPPDMGPPAPAMPGGFDPSAAMQQPPPPAPMPPPDLGPPAPAMPQPSAGGFAPGDPASEAQRFADYVAPHLGASQDAQQGTGMGVSPDSAVAPVDAAQAPLGDGFSPAGASSPADEAARFADYATANGATIAGDRPPSEFEQPSAFGPGADLAAGLAKGYTGQPEAVVQSDQGDQSPTSPDRPPSWMEGILNVGPFGMRTPVLPPIVPPNVTPPDQQEQQRVLEGRSPVETGGELVGKTAGFLSRQVQSEPGAVAEMIRPGAGEEAERTIAAQEARGGTGGGRLSGLVSGVGEVVGDAGGLEARTGEHAAEIARLRLDKVPEEAQATVQRAAERGDFWRQQRRNVITDAESEKMADELGRTVDQMIAGGTIGRAYNAETTRALRNGLIGQALKVDDLKATVTALGDAASDDLRRQLGQEEATLLALSRVFEGARAEAGRTFRAYMNDGRGRLLRARGPQYTNVSRVPITAAPELGPGVEQAGFVRDPELHRQPVDPGPAAPPLAPTFGRPIEQGTIVDPLAHYPDPMDVAPQPPAPPSSVPRLTEQAALPGASAPLARGTKPMLQKQWAKERGLTTPAEGAPSRYDRAMLLRTAGMLSGVPTHLFNATGNAVLGALTVALKPAQVGADLARVGIGRALGKDVERQRYMAEVGPQAAGYAQGWWAGLGQVPGILGRGPDDQLLANVGGRRLASGSAKLDTAVEMPLRALAASDAVFRGAAFGGHSTALAVRQATREGLSGAARTARVQEILGNLSDYPGLIESANRLAARDVLQESRAGTDIISKARSWRPEAAPQAGSAIGVGVDLAMPFHKTPYNVAAQGAGMTPAGLYGILESAKRGETGEAVDRAVRATVGTMGIGLGLTMADNGLLTGPYPQDPQERSTLPEGWRPYSFRVPTPNGTVYVPTVAVGSLAVPLAVAATWRDAERRGKTDQDTFKTVVGSLGDMGKFMMDQSAFQGLNALSRLVTDPARSGETFLEGLASSQLPMGGLARTVQQALGDAQRDPRNPLEAVMALVPVLSRLVPEKQTTLGGTRSRGLEGPVALVTGGRLGVEVPDTTLAALRDAGLGVPDPPRTVDPDPTTPGTTPVPLTEDDQRLYRRLAGENLTRRVGAILSSPTYRSTPVKRQREILSNAVEQARIGAANGVLNAMGRPERNRRQAEERAHPTEPRPLLPVTTR